MTCSNSCLTHHERELESGAEASALGSSQAAEVETLPDLDAGNVIEEAEQLLRQSAPHDFDVLVIGSGPGGHAAALRAAQLGAHVGIVEDRQVGGTSLNRGCLPTKLLGESAGTLRLLQQAGQFGIALDGEFKTDLAAMQARKKARIDRLREESWETLLRHNVELVQGRAKFAGKHTVEVTTESGSYRVKAVHIVIAAGSLAQRPALNGADLPGVFISDELLNLEAVPESIVTLGSGAVGLEMASLFRTLGAKSTILAPEPALLPNEDQEIVSAALELLQRDGLHVETNAEAFRIGSFNGRLTVHYKHTRAEGIVEKAVQADAVLLALDRVPNTAGLALDRAGIAHADGKILVDENRQTTVAGVYAIGDCIRGTGSAPLAAAEGILVAEHLARQAGSVDLEHVPSCHYTRPEMASAGLTEFQARERGFKPHSGKAYFKDNHHSVSHGEEDGWVKVVFDAGSRRILGCQIIGQGATELINHVVLALKSELTVDELANTVFAHPTLGEILPAAARVARSAAWGGDTLPGEDL